MAEVIDWKTFSSEKLAEIEKVREEAKQKNVPRDPKGTYKLMCPACTKPNSLSVDFCTGCSFSLSQWDAKKQSDNIFLDLINGIDIGTKVHYRDDDILIFDDKFGVSPHHIQVIENISFLDASHIPLLEKMYQKGLEEFLSRHVPIYEKRGIDIETMLVSGYNFPVSVKHLHLHLVLPPYRHEKVFQYPRWHDKQKIINDLKQHGKVQTYDQFPNDEEGKKLYEIVLANHRKALQWKNEDSSAESKQSV